MTERAAGEGPGPGPVERAGDEQSLIDYVLGRCGEPERQQLLQRLGTDRAFAALHADVANALAALGQWSAPEPPDDLAQRTLQRIRALRRTEMLLDSAPAGEEPRGPVFSFRELAALAAAAVIAVAILLPSLPRARQEAQRSLCQSQVGQVGAALRHYAAGHDDLLPAARAEQEWWLPGANRPHTSNSQGLFLLVRHRLASTTSFQCPAAGGESFQIRARMIDFPGPRSLGYSYQYTINTRLALSGLHPARALYSDENPYFSGGRFHPERLGRTVSFNHSDDGQNVLYPDGHVLWVTHSCVGVSGDDIFLAEGVTAYEGREKPGSPNDSFVLPCTAP